MAPRTRALLLAGVLVLVGFASRFARSVAHDKLEVAGLPGWVATDPDTLYHVRRVARLLEEGPPVASHDPRLAYPDGARIPWPPYYTRLVATLVDVPEAPTDSRAEVDWRAAVEQGVASTPLLFGIGATLLTALLAAMIAGPAAGMFAGVCHAFCVASIGYSQVGNGDHHALVALLLALELVLFSAAAGTSFGSSRRSTLLGGVAGAVAGYMLGTWVASLVYIVAFQLVLGWFLFVNARQRMPGLAPFGLSFHVGALAAALPAILASPWKDEFPWMTVNLSWFHVAHLALGGLVFVPLLARRMTTAGARARYPLVVTAALAVLGALVLTIDAGPGRGIREGFEWVSRADQFMSGIQESRPLLTTARIDGDEIRRLLGEAVVLLPLAWILALIATVKGSRRILVPLVVVTPILAAQASSQARFADALSVAAWALVGGLFASAGARCTQGLQDRLERARWARTWLGPALGCLAALAAAGLAQHAALVPIWQQWRATGTAPRPVPRRAAAVRAMLEWIRTETPPDGDYAVLANWSQGHALEWGADRPSVATNFGSYIGFDSYADPGRFFLAEDPVEAEAVLDARRARYVLLTSGWPNAVRDMIRAACPERAERYLLQSGERSGRLLPPWFETIGARLMFSGGIHPAAGPAATRSPGARLDFLRLVHASPARDRRPPLGAYGVQWSPWGWVWEHVQGARLEARAEPGTALTVEFRVELGLADVSFDYRASAVADDQGVARLRVPYGTLEANGDARVTGEPRWQIGDRTGRLEIREADVLEGRTVRVGE